MVALSQVKAFLFALTLAVLVSSCKQQTFVSGSMAPTIASGEKVTVDYSAYTFASPKRWEVVAFTPPGKTNQTWLMRIIGLPGEKVGLESGGITLNGQPLALPSHLSNITYVSLESIGQWSSNKWPYTVPPGSYFVLGDNSTSANDSRFWGALPGTNILGKVRGK